MVRDGRIKSTEIRTGSLTSDAGGEFDAYTETPINGHIKKLEWRGGNYTKTGSLIVQLSGGNSETILSLTSGTAVGYGNVSDARDFYPRRTVDTINGSPVAIGDVGTEIVSNTLIHVVGSGMGNAKSGLGLNVYWV